MSKEQDKKKVTVKKETVALPAVENKAADSTTEVVPVVVKEEVKEAPKPVANKRKALTPFDNPNRTLPEQTEEVTLSIARLDKLEIDKLVTAELRSPYISNRKDEEINTGSTLIIHGQRLEPWVAGVKGSLDQIKSNYNHYGYDWRFDRDASWITTSKEERNWDVYVYALERTSTDWPGHNGSENIAGKLSEKLEQRRIYQIVFLDHGSRLEITDKLSMPGRWESCSLLDDGKPGIAYIMESEITNAIFIGENSIQGLVASDVIMNQVRIIAGSVFRTNIRNAIVEKSHLIGVSSYGEKPHARNRISRCTINSAHFNDSHYSIVETELKDVSFAAKNVNVKKSRLTGMSFTAKQNIDITATGSHYHSVVNFNSNNNIEVNSIYDLTVMSASERLVFSLVNGGESFWLNISGQDEYGSSIYEVAKAIKAARLEEEDRRGYPPRPWGMRDGRYEERHSIEDYVMRAIVQTLGAGEVSENIGRHIAKALNDRVGIARSIATVKKLEMQNVFTNW